MARMVRRERRGAARADALYEASGDPAYRRGIGAVEADGRGDADRADAMNGKQ